MRFISIMFFCFAALNIYAQNVVSKVTYLEQAKSNKFGTFYSDLWFDNNSSLFIEIPNELKNSTKKDGDGTTFIQHINTPDKELDYYFHQINKSEFLFRHHYMGKSLYVKDTLEFIWEIKGQTKKILGYRCQMATTIFKGRNYIAWFNTELIYPFGPWKFHGLPGLIMELKEENNLVHFYIKRMELNKKDINRIDLSEVSFKDNDYLNFEMYCLEKKILLKKTVKLLQSRLPQGTNLAKECKDCDDDELEVCN
jgi:GLPGLI family protein